MAIADGLGSATQSHVGAELVARSVASALSDATDSAGGINLAGKMREAIATASLAVQAKANDADLPVRDFASTLVVAVVSTSPTDAGYDAIVGRVGDSTAIRVVDGSLEELFVKEDAVVHSSATLCVPLDAESFEITSFSLGCGQALVLATDGFHVPATDEPWAQHFASRWRQAPGLDGLLTDLHFLARTYTDDRTVAGCWTPTCAEEPARS
jgi:hypothetical protein